MTIIPDTEAIAGGATRPNVAPAGVLVVEDEAIVALDLQFIVEDMGLPVIGPCATVRDGIAEAGQNRPSVAILDVKLTDGEVFALADILHAEHVPLIFHSGHADQGDLSRRYPGATFCPKPTTPSQIERCVARAIATA